MKYSTNVYVKGVDCNVHFVVIVKDSDMFEGLEI